MKIQIRTSIATYNTASRSRTVMKNRKLMQYTAEKMQLNIIYDLW